MNHDPASYSPPVTEFLKNYPEFRELVSFVRDHSSANAANAPKDGADDTSTYDTSAHNTPELECARFLDHHLWRKKQHFVPFSELVPMLSEETMTQLGFTRAQRAMVADQILPMLRDVDQVTGLNAPYSRHLNVALAAYYAKLHTDREGHAPPLHIVSGDFSNLRGLNVVLSGGDIRQEANAIKNAQNHEGVAPSASSLASREGNQHANKILRMVAHIFSEEMVALKQKFPEVTVKCYRSGGDEFDAIIAGAPEQEIEKAQKKIHDRVESLVKELGLDRIMHPKYSTSASHRGIGFTCACGSYSADDTVNQFHQLEKNLEKIIEGEKARLGMARFRRTKAQPSNPKEMEAFRRDGGEILSDGTITQFSENALSGIIGKIDLKYREMGLEDRAIPLPHTPFQMHAAPFGDQLSLTAGQEYYAKLFQAFEQQEVQGKKAEFIAKLSHMARNYDMAGRSRKDPSGDGMQLRRDSFAVELSRSLERLKTHPGEKKIALVIELQNFSGINQNYSHERCNEYLKHVTQCVSERFVAAPGNPLGTVYAYHPGGRGDRIFLMIEDTDNPVMLFRAVKGLTEDVQQYADDHHELGGIANPRHNDKQSVGIRAVVAGERLHAGKFQHAGEVFDALTVQLDGNKHHLPEHRIFSGATFDDDAFCIPFNASAETLSHLERYLNERQLETDETIVPERRK